MKKIFMKAMTVLGSAMLIGSTAGMAGAAMYPEPFTSNTAGIVGANAAISDNAALATIGSDLISAAAGGAGGNVEVTGESYMFERAATKFHIGDYIVNLSTTSLDDSELPVLLAKGEYTDDDNDAFDYTQKNNNGK
jgi:type IV secretory pathway TrbL component